MVSTHALACARKIIRRADENGWPKAKLVHAIVEHCGHSRLRSHRLANGWTLEDVVEHVSREYEALNGGSCHLNSSRVSKWERGEESPGKKYVAALCRAFQSDPVSLGIVVGMRDINDEEKSAAPSLTASQLSEQSDLIVMANLDQEQD